MSKLTKPQRARLERLAAYLEGLPKNYRHFHMSTFFEGAECGAEADYARHNGGMCGTAACAAGHGPAAGILVPPRFMMETGGVDWGSYTALFVSHDEYGNDWCFEGAWASVDNHHWGAAARIRYLLDHGAPPDNYWFAEKKFLPLYAPYRIDAKAPA